MNNQEKKYELIKFEDGGFSLDVNVSPSEDTVWLTQKDMALLFNVSIDNISLHIKNIINDGELDQSVFEESSITASDGKKYKTKIYNLDMIIAVGYRVNSKQGTQFRKWANQVISFFATTVSHRKSYFLGSILLTCGRICAIIKLNKGVTNLYV